MEEIDLEQLTLARFSTLVDTPFRVVSDAGVAVDLVLTEAAPGRTRGGQSPTTTPLVHRSFSLLFRGSSPDCIAQGTYRFEHEKLGACRLFVVPVGPGPGGCFHQVVFNRLEP